MPLHNNPDIARGFTGRVHDALTMHFENGAAVATFTVAKQTTAAAANVVSLGLCRVVCLGKRAEFVAAYLKSGQRVFVAGPDASAADGSQTPGGPMTEIVASCVIPLGRLAHSPCARSRRVCADKRRAG